MKEKQENHDNQRQDNDLVVPFKSKKKFINLLFKNTSISKVTYKKTILFFIINSLIFLSVSIFFFFQTSKVIEIERVYYEPFLVKCMNCKIQIKQTMHAPVYFMYKLDNFYQNHRRYIQSKSNYQLAGNILDNDKTEICYPKITNGDMKKSISWNGTLLSSDAIASPCGYIAAYTYFNDTFAITTNGTNISINQHGISWPGDKGGKYKRAPDSQKTQWVDPQNEHFIVWMRTSGLPHFSKLWGIIEKDLTPGNYTVQIGLNYESKEWEGARSFVLTTKSAIGGKNYWLPSLFLVIGTLGGIAVIIFYKKMAEFNSESRKAAIQ